MESSWSGVCCADAGADRSCLGSPRFGGFLRHLKVNTAADSSSLRRCRDRLKVRCRRLQQTAVGQSLMKQYAQHSQAFAVHFGYLI